jgi:hypothetical protein
MTWVRRTDEMPNPGKQEAGSAIELFSSIRMKKKRPGDLPGRELEML